MNESELALDFEELSSAEDFLDYFGIDYQPSVVHVNRLHILQRFHDYLDAQASLLPDDDSGRYAVYARLLTRAYRDFVESDPLTEKVFRVFQSQEPAQVPVGDLLRRFQARATKV